MRAARLCVKFVSEITKDPVPMTATLYFQKPGVILAQRIGARRLSPYLSSFAVARCLEDGGAESFA
jgi:hypothetical protein